MLFLGCFSSFDHAAGARRPVADMVGNSRRAGCVVTSRDDDDDR
jgi:hypothetical protein